MFCISWMSLSNFQVSTFHFQVSIFHFQVSTFHFQVSIFHFQVSTFHFQVFTFHFQVSTFQFVISILQFSLSIKVHLFPSFQVSSSTVLFELSMLSFTHSVCIEIMNVSAVFFQTNSNDSFYALTRIKHKMIRVREKIILSIQTICIIFQIVVESHGVSAWKVCGLDGSKRKGELQQNGSERSEWEELWPTSRAEG